MLDAADVDLAHELHDLVRTLGLWAERILRPEGLGHNRCVALVIVAASGIVRSLLDAGSVEDLAPPSAGARPT